MKLSIVILSLLACTITQAPVQAETVEILNVSYDPTREFYQDFNAAFATHWKDRTGQTLVVRQSHGGSGKQARAVIDGLEADVVTLALAFDIDTIAMRSKLLPSNWQDRLPHRSAPYTSTIVFLVRKGNPKGISDWNDLVKPDIAVITPNPKTSGGARWNYLAAWAYAEQHFNKDQHKVQEFMTKLFQNVPVLDTGARGSTMTFVQREIGDVLLAWENEAFLAQNELGPDRFQIVVPSLSILAEPPVALIDQHVDQHGTRKAAEAYLEYLYSEEAQALAGKHYYRPISEAALKQYPSRFPKIQLVTIQEICGSWKAAQEQHFNDGGTFDQIYASSSQTHH